MSTSSLQEALSNLSNIEFVNVSHLSDGVLSESRQFLIEFRSYQGIGGAELVIRDPPISGSASLIRNTISGVPILGKFALQFGGQVSGTPLHANSSANDVKHALEGLSNIGTVAVERFMDRYESQGYDRIEWYITFTGRGIPDNIGRQPIVQVKNSSLSASCLDISTERIHEPCCEVKLSIDNQSFISNSAYYRYDKEATVMKVQPEAGPYFGGTQLVIEGINFRVHDASNENLVQSYCIFYVQYGTSCTSEAKVLNSSTAICFTPPLSTCGVSQFMNENPVFVHLKTLDDYVLEYQISKTAVVFTYVRVPEMNILKASPLQGSTKGVTVVSLVLESKPVGQVFCVFNQIYIAAEVDNSTATVTCVEPEHPVGIAQLRLSDGQHRTTSALVFTYIEPIILSPQDLFSTVEGGHTVYINGSSFALGYTVQCDIHGTLTDATWVSETQVKCATQAFEGRFKLSTGLSFMSKSSTSFELQVGNNRILVSNGTNAVELKQQLVPITRDKWE